MSTYQAVNTETHVVTAVGNSWEDAIAETQLLAKTSHGVNFIIRDKYDDKALVPAVNSESLISLYGGVSIAEAVAYAESRN